MRWRSQEVDDVLKEQTILERCTNSLGSHTSIGGSRIDCIGSGFNSAIGTYGLGSIANHLGYGRQMILQAGQVYTTGQQADCRHQHIINQRGDDFAESTTDDNTDSHVHHVALHGKLLKLFNKTHNFTVLKN